VTQRVCAARRWASAATLALFLLAPFAPWAEAQSAPIQYVYDRLDRLVAVVNAAGDVAVYQYDAVGNLLAIQRVNAADIPGAVGITFVYAETGTAGSEVLIFGKGFSDTPASNTVTFNGTTATVTSSKGNRVTTTVPVSATTGAIVVTSRSQSNDNATVLQQSDSSSQLFAESRPSPVAVPLRLPNRAQSYLLDCAFLI
jgi:YD repeat-containing protein